MIRLLNHFFQSRKLPLRIFFLFLAGFFWFTFDFFYSEGELTPCYFKNVSGYACPACGTTRAFECLVKGEFVQALYFNPLFLILIISIIILLPSLCTDLIFGSNKTDTILWRFNQFFENKPYFLFIFLFCILINWIWNLMKY